MANYLAYGAIGLGLALAVLAYRLLSKEQERPGAARGPLLRATYVFMAFALALAAGGFVSEYLKSEASQIGAVRADLEKTSGELQVLRTKHQEVREGLNVSRTVMRSLMDLKQGKVTRLKQLDPLSPEYVPLVKEIQADLELLDKGLRKALDE
jgi:hypothetical protein